MASSYGVEKRRRAVELASKGVPVKAISQRLGVCERTVRRWVKGAA